MHRSISFASFTVVTSFCILGCHGAPPPEAASAGDTKAQPTTASSEANGAGSEAKPAEGQAGSDAKSASESEKPAAASADAKDCPQGGCTPPASVGQASRMAAATISSAGGQGAENRAALASPFSANDRDRSSYCDSSCSLADTVGVGSGRWNVAAAMSILGGDEGGRKGSADGTAWAKPVATGQASWYLTT